MAVQAVLNPSPLQFLAKASPAPSDVVWPNTYLSRSSRMFRAWSITVLITVLTIFWTFLLVPIAGALNTCSIEKVFPQLAKALKQHPNVESLVNTQLPTIVLSLLNVLVPYFYDCKAYPLPRSGQQFSYGDRARESARNDLPRGCRVVSHI